MKLNQVIAILQTAKKNCEKAKTEVYHKIQKSDLFKGLSRVYRPVDEDGYVYPPENKKLTLKTEELLGQFAQACQNFYDLAATQDWANAKAKASVVVDGVVILEDVPVAYLLFLEKQITDLRTFVSTLPVLPITEDWQYDPGRGCYVTTPKETTKTKKITEFVRVFEPTEHHPGEAREVSKDIVEGTWSVTEFSGALPQDRVTLMAKRVEKLYQAIVKAREEANGAIVEEKIVSSKIFDYLFA